MFRYKCLWPAAAVMATPSKLASEWFPPHQRTLATSIGVVANTGVAFLLALPVHTSDQVLLQMYGEAAFAGLVRACPLLTVT